MTNSEVLVGVGGFFLIAFFAAGLTTRDWRGITLSALITAAIVGVLVAWLLFVQWVVPS